jgi:hypothetical protein
VAAAAKRREVDGPAGVKLVPGVNDFPGPQGRLFPRSSEIYGRAFSAIACADRPALVSDQGG